MEKILKINKDLIKQTLEKFGTPFQFELCDNSLALLYMEMGDFFDPITKKRNLKDVFGHMFGKKIKHNDSLPVNTIKFCYLNEKVIDKNVKTNKIK
jgi:hypothetical protein